MIIKKSASLAIQFLLVLSLLLGSFLSFSQNVQVAKAEAPTPVTGIITSDTTWTKVNSPYVLTGDIRVNEGITLTIEPGVIAYLNNSHLTVDGILDARGTSTDKISLI